MSALVATAALVLTLLPSAAGAQQAPQVQGLKVTQHHGYATLSWTPAQDATAYQIERTPVTATFADAGAGYAWRRPAHGLGDDAGRAVHERH